MFVLHAINMPLLQYISIYVHASSLGYFGTTRRKLKVTYTMFPLSPRYVQHTCRNGLLNISSTIAHRK